MAEYQNKQSDLSHDRCRCGIARVVVVGSRCTERQQVTEKRKRTREKKLGHTNHETTCRMSKVNYSRMPSAN